MKKIIFSLVIYAISFSVNAQVWQLEAVKLKKGSEKEYLETEKFWGKVKKLAVKEDKLRAWYVFKNITKVEEGKERRYDYFVFNFYKDKAEMNSNIDMLDLAMRAHKGKLSKSKIRYNFQNWDRAREYTNTYTLERLDRTINTVPVSKNTPVYIYPMAEKNEEYENLEMKFAKKSHEIDILDYRKAFWAFDKIIDRSENANKEITHFTFEKYTSDNLPKSRRTDWDKMEYEESLMWDMALKSRKGFPRVQLEFVMSTE